MAVTAVLADIAPNRIALGIAVAVTVVAAVAVVLRWRIIVGVDAVATILTSAKIGYCIEPATAVPATAATAGAPGATVRTRSALAVAVTAVAAVAAAGRIRPALAVAVTAMAAVMVSGASAVRAVAANGPAARGEKLSIN